jgi:hypothetical protein
MSRVSVSFRYSDCRPSPAFTLERLRRVHHVKSAAAAPVPARSPRRNPVGLTTPLALLPPAFKVPHTGFHTTRHGRVSRIGWVGARAFELAEGRCGKGSPGCLSSRIRPRRRPVVSNRTIGPRAGSRPVAAVGAPGWRVVRHGREVPIFGSCTPDAVRALKLEGARIGSSSRPR